MRAKARADAGGREPELRPDLYSGCVMTVRMKDIAKDLGLSVVTISKVLRNHPDIAEETRERVLKRVKELDYQPNLMARSLVTGRSYLIGLVVPSLLHSFFAEVAVALSAEVGRRGYSLLLASSDEQPEVESREIQQMMARHLDALVIATCSPDNRMIERLERTGSAYVLIDRAVEGAPGNFVGTDDYAAGRMATEHLIAQGCRRIAHIRGPRVGTAEARLQGYRAALAAHGLPCREELVVASERVDNEATRHGAEAMQRLLDAREQLDGLFAFNDPLAIGAMQVALGAGLRIPDDLAVIGCGNLHFDNLLRVPLSSMDQQSAEIGRQTAAIVLERIESRVKPEPKRVVLEPKLIERASSRRRSMAGPGREIEGMQ